MIVDLLQSCINLAARIVQVVAVLAAGGILHAITLGLINVWLFDACKCEKDDCWFASSALLETIFGHATAAGRVLHRIFHHNNVNSVTLYMP